MAPRPPLPRRKRRCGPPWPANARSWPRTGASCGPLRVRMALHAGEAIPDAHGDYLAAPLNRLARLLATGYGGQILLSQTVQQLTRGALPAGSELRDLGRAPAAGSAGAGAGLSAAAPGPAGRVPAPQVSREPAQQPAVATDALPGSGAGGAADRRPPASSRGPLPHADRSRRAPARPDWPSRRLPNCSMTSPTGSTSCRWPRSPIPIWSSPHRDDLGHA